MLPLSAFDAVVDPNTWTGANRPNGQLVVAGDRFNPGETNGNMGYGLQFEGTSIDSFEMVNGDTLRWGTSNPEDLPGESIISSVQWQTNEGYDPNAEVGARNPSVPTPPNDPLFFDGTRNQMSFGDVGVRSGPNADRVLMGTLFRIADWAPHAQDNKAVLMNVHAPNVAPLSSPVSTAIDHGRLRIVVRTSTSTSPTNSSRNNTIVYDAAIPASSVGDWWALVYEMRMSPNAGDDPIFNAWLRTGPGEDWVQIVNHEGPVGFVYDGYASNGTSASQLNGANYPILAGYYSYHKWGNTFDLRYPVRTTEFGFSGAIVGTTTPATDLLATIDHYAGWT